MKTEKSFRVDPAGWLRAVPAVMMMGLIFSLSDQQGDALVLPDIVNIDKLLHSLIYGALALAGLFFLPRSTRHDRPAYRGTLVVLFCLAYGFSDELHQVFVPGRFPSVWDILADVTGAFLAVVLYYRFTRPPVRQSLLGPDVVVPER